MGGSSDHNRVPEAFLRDVLAQTDIVALIGRYVELKPAGKDLKGLSPFTKERTPSFFVSPAKQMFFDFSCGKNGNSIGFLMAHQKLTFREALTQLATAVGMEVPKPGAARRDDVVVADPADALAAAARLYRGFLLKHQPAIDYLKKLNVNGESAKRYRIGYAPGGGSALSALFRDKRPAVQAGVLYPDGRDALQDVIAIAIRDSDDWVLGFASHPIGKPHQEAWSLSSAAGDPGVAVFGLVGRPRPGEAPPTLLLLPTALQAVVVSQMGAGTAVAAPDTPPRAGQWEEMFRFSDQVTCVLPDDRNGQISAWKMSKSCLPVLADGHQVRIAFAPAAKGIVGYAQDLGPDEFKKLTQNAQTAQDFLLASLGSKYGRGDAGVARKEYQLAIRTLRDLSTASGTKEAFDRALEGMGQAETAAEDLLHPS